MPKPSSSSSKTYAVLSTRPLHVLVFLLPLIVAYEVGLVVFLHGKSGAVETIKAHEQLSQFFKLFGTAAPFLPGIAMVLVLFTWHVFERDKWKLYPSVLAGMLAESFVWMLPLLVMGLLLSKPAAIAIAGDVETLDMPSRAALSVGAGLYEELLFRLVGISAAHFVLVDVLRVKDMPARVLAVGASAVAFALYHNVLTTTGGSWSLAPVHLVLFYLLAGAYFGAVFLLRGFGIVVAVHMLYDLMALVLLPALKDQLGGH